MSLMLRAKKAGATAGQEPSAFSSEGYCGTGVSCFESGYGCLRRWYGGNASRCSTDRTIEPARITPTDRNGLSIYKADTPSNQNRLFLPKPSFQTAPPQKGFGHTLL